MSNFLTPKQILDLATEQWDNETIAEEMAASIAEKLGPTATAVATPAKEIITPMKRPAPAPIDGSQTIQFSNRTNSQLAGCSSIGIIEVLHTGIVDDALIILKNEAYRLNTNILVPLTMNQTDVDPIASANIQIEARMMKCPLKLARGN